MINVSLKCLQSCEPSDWGGGGPVGDLKRSEGCAGGGGGVSSNKKSSCCGSRSDEREMLPSRPIDPPAPSAQVQTE